MYHLSECQIVWIKIMPDIYLVRCDLDPNYLQRLSADNTIVGKEIPVCRCLYIWIVHHSLWVPLGFFLYILKYKYTEHKKKHNTKN